MKCDQSFILTTDADVKFTHESVEALIEQIIEDPGVGAVCARTHPMGSGPIVWYQIFDYAIGHWFQKVCISFTLSVDVTKVICFSLQKIVDSHQAMADDGDANRNVKKEI